MCRFPHRCSRCACECRMVIGLGTKLPPRPARQLPTPQEGQCLARVQSNSHLVLLPAIAEVNTPSGDPPPSPHHVTGSEGLHPQPACSGQSNVCGKKPTDQGLEQHCPASEALSPASASLPSAAAPTGAAEQQQPPIRYPSGGSRKRKTATLHETEAARLCKLTTAASPAAADPAVSCGGRSRRHAGSSCGRRSRSTTPAAKRHKSVGTPGKSGTAAAGQHKDLLHQIVEVPGAIF